MLWSKKKFDFFILYKKIRKERKQVKVFWRTGPLMAETGRKESKLQKNLRLSENIKNIFIIFIFLPVHKRWYK